MNEDYLPRLKAHWEWEKKSDRFFEILTPAIGVILAVAFLLLLNHYW